MTPREWNTAVATGLLRIVVGSALLRWRHPLSQRLAGASPDDRVVPLLFGYFGARDVTLGVLTLAATRPDGNVAKLVALQGAADATDAILVGAAVSRGHISRVRGLGAIAVAVISAAGEFATSLGLRRA